MTTRLRVNQCTSPTMMGQQDILDFLLGIDLKYYYYYYYVYLETRQPFGHWRLQYNYTYKLLQSWIFIQ